MAPHAARCSRWGARLDEYRKAWPQQLLLMVQIETAEAVENIEEIAAVDGVDMLFMGPGDIAASLGHVMDPDNVPMIQLRHHPGLDLEPFDELRVR